MAPHVLSAAGAQAQAQHLRHPLFMLPTWLGRHRGSLKLLPQKLPQNHGPSPAHRCLRRRAHLERLSGGTVRIGLPCDQHASTPLNQHWIALL